MIEPGRTNLIPKTLLGLCIALFIMRASAVFYGTYFQKAPAKAITWQQPKPIDRSRRDLLSKPTLYFFYEDYSPLQKVTAEVFESMLFQNREVARLVKDEFIPVKVAINTSNSEPAKSLTNTLGVYQYPSIYITLPNGKSIHQVSWQSDRMFHAFLNDALIARAPKAAGAALENLDWALACEAYELAFKEHAYSPYSGICDEIYWSIALRHQNNEAKAKQVLEREWKERRIPEFIRGKEDWPKPCIDYLLGKITAEELEKKATLDPHSYKKALSQYVIGENLLLQGKRDEAIKALKLSAEASKAYYMHDSKYARAQLRQLGEKVEDEKEESDLRSIY